jgi:hypothetical protein
LVSENTAILLNFGDGKEGIVKITSFMDLTPDSYYNRIRINEKISTLDELKKEIVKKIVEKNIFY